jgi:anti-sigma B factor antagonist
MDEADQLSDISEPRLGDLLQVHREVVHSGAGGLLVRVAGEVDLVTVPQLEDELTMAEKDLPPSGRLVLDLTAVTFVASAGLSVLIKHDQRCREAGKELRIVSGNRTIARTFLMTGLTETLIMFDTLDAALETIR